MSTRWLKWTLGCAAAVLLGLVATFVWLARPSHITALVQSGLAEHLQLDATLDRIEVSWLPRPSIHAQGFALRMPNQPDLPPLIAIDEFSVDIGPLSLIRKRVDTVYARGLHITVPPGDVRDDLPGRDGQTGRTDIIISHFITEDASLQFLRNNGRKPLTFAIHDLRAHEIGFGLAMPFDATITNPVPTGLVTTTGTFGPWVPGEIFASPLEGDYTFEHADLSTINGIGGTLESTGHYSGTIQRIVAQGQAQVPDFSLDLGGRPQALTADFDAVVTGTNGTTVLERVDATLVHTRMAVEGAVINLDGPGNHALEFAVKIEDGRIEDILALIIDSPQPVMTGDVVVDARMALPPGPAPVSRRLSVDGRFGLAETTFTDKEVQSKMESLSRRSQGKDEEDPIGKVLTNLRGQVRLANGTARLSRLTFQVPGARVALDGTYGLATGALDFRGTLRMQATVSQAVGGFKSIFLKPFNPLFRKDGAGAVIPIKIEGTREAPKFGVEFGKIF
ncbi:MAG: hypothetical protein ABS36_15995 [Acidobacteria bacterium SCN 69-37]|nr:MAG: hypothetical protein ABS36_15995 [Acidobacteria bacterium SCN 69-37]